MTYMDWPTTVDEFARMFEGKLTRQSPGLDGRNFMTPDWLGYLDVEGLPVEVTTGHGMRGERIYGVTFPRLPGGGCDERDACLSSLEAVYVYLYGYEEES